MMDDDTDKTRDKTVNEPTGLPTDKPDCFGHLDQVFPMTGTGLRETPEKCMDRCGLKTPCLKQAMRSDQATRVEEEIIERGTKTGAINFFERWSRKKQIHRKTKRNRR